MSYDIFKVKQYPKVQGMLASVFPSYKKHSFFIHIRDSVELYGTYWDGGSRNDYCKVSFPSYSRNAMGHTNPPQFGGPKETPTIELNDTLFIIQSGIFCGKKSTISIHCTKTVFDFLMQQ